MPEPEEGAVQDAVEQTEGTVAEATPPIPSPDAAPTDIDRLRSVKDLEVQAERRRAQLLQQQLERLQQEWFEKQKADYDKETADMSDVEKRAYDAEMRSKQLEVQYQQQQQQLNQVREVLQAEQQREAAIKFFEDLGAPREYLERNAGSKEELVAAYAHYVNTLKEHANRPAPQAPKVATSKPTQGAGDFTSRWVKMTPDERNALIERARQGRLAPDEWR